MEQNEQKIVEVLKEDNRKPKFESYLGEINYMKNDIQNAIDNLSEWMQPKKPSKPLTFIMDQVGRFSYYYYCSTTNANFIGSN